MSPSLEMKQLRPIALVVGVCWPMTRSLGAEMNISDVRPVKGAVERLEKEFHVPITYEDPLYIFPGDVEDITAKVARPEALAATSRPRVIKGMKSRDLRFSYSRASTTTSAFSSARLAVGSALDANNTDYPPAIFDVADEGGRLHVYPKKVKNKLGEYVAQRSLLDVPISIEPEERTALEFVQLLCSALSRESETLVETGMLSLNYWSQQRTSLGGKNRPAREFLVALLAELEGRDPQNRHKFSWELLSDATDGEFALNFHTVLTDSSAGAGAPRGTIRNSGNKTRHSQTKEGSARPPLPPGRRAATMTEGMP
jgi:hypothetical protein